MTSHRPDADRGDGADSRDDDAGGVGVMGSRRHDLTLLMSYRFLRCGIVLSAVALMVSLVWEISRTGCVRNSISAYFYSPVRTMFTGGLIAAGLCLVVLQGDDDVEEVSLNFAGLFAPMVAVVPTRVSVECDARFVGLDAKDRQSLIDEIGAVTRDGLQNNLVAYFGVVLVVLALLFLFPHQFVRDRRRVTGMRVAVAAYFVVVLVFAAAAYRTWQGEQSWAHNLSAILMFVAFGVVVWHNGWRRQNVPRWYSMSCRVLALAMGVALVVCLGVIGAVFDARWDVFALEASELVLFAAFWSLQTYVFWNRDLVTGEEVAMSVTRAARS